MSNLPLEAIKLRVRAVAADCSVSDSGHLMVSVTGSVVDHEQYTGEEITTVLHFSPKAMERAAESLIHFGFQHDDPTMLYEADATKCAELLPEVVEFDCSPEEWDGKWRLKVNWVNKAGRGKFSFKNKVESGDLRAFGAQLKSVFKGVRGAGGARKPTNGGNGSRPQQPHPNAPGSGYGGAKRPDDDIPF